MNKPICTAILALAGAAMGLLFHHAAQIDAAPEPPVPQNQLVITAAGEVRSSGN